ncbi:MAG: hypothetical protein IRZ28_06935 [Steroidobacteraceae bacterium]|nr:hypothetical protein [Steroidobacteraceae bacterium]
MALDWTPTEDFNEALWFLLKQLKASNPTPHHQQAVDFRDYLGSMRGGAQPWAAS